MDRALQVSPAETAHLAVVEEPAREPIVLVVGGQTFIVGPDDAHWPIAWHATEVEQDLKRAERDLRGKRALIAKVRKHNEDEDEKARKAHPSRGVIIAVFERWRVRTGHLRAKLTPERFDMIASRLAEDYEPLDLHMAVEGLAAHPFVADGRKMDDLKACMKEGSQVERYANLAPADVRQRLRMELGTPPEPQQEFAV